MSRNRTNKQIYDRLDDIAYRIEAPEMYEHYRRQKTGHRQSDKPEVLDSVSSILHSDKNIPQPVFRLTYLPLELITRVLRYLDGTEIACFQVVSRMCRNIIQSSSELQYAMNLSIFEAVNGPTNAPYALRERLESLHKWKAAWNGAEFTGPETKRSIDNGVTIRSFGSLVAYGDKNDERGWLCLRRLSSALRGVSPQTWRLDDLPPFPFNAYACEDDQDLLVLLEEFEGQTKVRVHLLACSTGKPHPLAPKQPLFVEVHAPMSGGRQIFNVAICATMVGVHASHDLRDRSQIHKEVWICNWQTGDQLLNIEGVHFAPSTLAFLDPRHIIVTGTAEYAQNIYVFVCPVVPRGRASMQAYAEEAALILRLPDLVSEGSYDYVAVETSPVRPQGRHADLPAKFAWSCMSPAVLISIDAVPEDQRFDRRLELLIPANTIISRIRGDSAKPVPWREWGEESRMFDMTDMGYGSVCGSRYATVGRCRRVLDGATELVYGKVVICDFDNASSMLRDITSEDDIIADQEERFVLFPWEDKAGRGLWNEYVETAAPCRIMRTDIEVGEWDSVLLVEDGVVVWVATHDEKKIETRVYSI